MLWWASAVVSYVVVVGLATLAIKLMRRPDASGSSETRRDDRFAGFLFGAAKGAVVAVFLTAAVQKYGLEAAKRSEWAGRQVDNSKALAWNQKYQPVPKIWESPPVRRFVEHIQRNGLSPTPVAAPAADEVAELHPEDGSRRPPRLDSPPWTQRPRTPISTLIRKSPRTSNGSGPNATPDAPPPTGVDPTGRVCKLVHRRDFSASSSSQDGLSLMDDRGDVVVRSPGRPATGWSAALILGAYWTLKGYHSLDGDQAHRLPLLLHQLDPRIYAADPFVRSFDAFNPHRGSLGLVGAVSRFVGLSTALTILFVLTFAASVRGVGRLRARPGLNRGAARDSSRLACF